MFDVNNIKIVGNTPDTQLQQNILSQNITNSNTVPIVSTKKFVRKRKVPAKQIISTSDREKALNELIDNIKEVDEDTGKPKYTHKENVLHIVEFIKNNYI